MPSHRQAAAFLRAIFGKDAQGQVTSRSQMRLDLIPVGLSLRFFNQEVKNRPIMPEVENFSAQVGFQNVSFQPTHGGGLRAKPPPGRLQSGGRNVENGEIAVTLAQEITDQGGSSASRIQNRSRLGQAGAVNEVQRRSHMLGVPAYVLGRPGAVDIFPMQLSVHHLPGKSHSDRDKVGGGLEGGQARSAPPS